MAMVIEGEERITAPVETVWRALNDPEILKACIPGCETLEKTSETELEAAVTLKVGPIKAKFKGFVELSNLNPPSPTPFQVRERAVSQALPRAARMSASRKMAPTRPSSPTRPRLMSVARWPSLAAA